VVKTVRIIRGLAAVAWLLTAASSAWGQRVQFATPVAPQSQPPTYAAPAPSYVQPPAGSPYPAPTLTTPSTTIAPPPTYAAPPGATLGAPSVAPLYTPPAGTVAPGVAAPGQAAGVPPPTWDPYATPEGTPSALLQEDPYFQGAGPALGATTMQKFLQHVELDYHWFAGHNGPEHNKSLGINDVELSATFAFPMFRNAETPLLITPGFAVHYWEGPASGFPLSADDPPPADLPPQTFDAYLDAAWNPQITAWLGAELDFRIGVYSDFKRVAADSLRYTGKGMAVLTLSPGVTIKAGVWYLDRNRVKILPAGGICWTPNPDVYFNILFPNPKIGRKLTTWGSTEWWIYGSGEYGGGRWAIKRNNGLPPNPFYPDTNGTYTTFDYNDIRIALGLEFNTMRRLHGMFEVGGAFGRELVYQDNLPRTFKPDSTVFLRAGLAY